MNEINTQEYTHLTTSEKDLNSMYQTHNSFGRKKSQIFTWCVIILFIVVIAITLFSMFVVSHTYDYCWGYKDKKKQVIGELMPFDLLSKKWFNADQRRSISRIQLYSTNNKFPILYRRVESISNYSVTLQNDSCRTISFDNGKYQEYICKLKGGKETDCTNCGCYLINID
ncbi:hypothetical protein M0813_09946 [Anaeramoeba flamelloides]|uniref:Uncharacterized protein n=1 Tax=Anaeramoeba flamelloides TaxID=1746091 RepID=A0AAV7YUH8_9EUKA|nr:hypothetical protein M0812_22458 [Anaeramoeba flamelloides]KAJ6227365.1 hypothetical protein M0813_09946 [Anaeramoeba flamelloides]